MESLECLPMDIMSDILMRLPAKPLLRFKCVSKSWYDLISDPYFAKRHLERSLATKTNLYFVYKDPLLKLADFDTFDNPIDVDYPFKYNEHAKIGGASIKGACNGLLCLHDYDYHHLTIALFNPTTRTYKVVPYLLRPSHVSHQRTHYTYGFGYDSVADDYKFVRIFEGLERENDTCRYSEVMVYSLKADSWIKVLDSSPYHFGHRRGDGVLVNGALHWVIDTELYQPLGPIVSFNLTTHSFAEVPVPDIDPYEYVKMHVGVLDGCLCIMADGLEESDIWVMKEYGVGKSWTRLLTAVKAREVHSLERTICFTKGGKELLVLLCLYRVTSIDMETKVIEPVTVYGNQSRRWDAHLCVENLLMLSDSCYFPDSDQQEGENSRRKRHKRRRRRRRNKRN